MQILKASDMLCSGAELWVVLKKHDCSNWQQINYYCVGLLEQNNSRLTPSMLLGVSDHFLAKWILYFDSHDLDFVTSETVRVCQSLNSSSVRFMNLSEKQISELQNFALARPMTSINSLSCVAPA